MILYKPDFKLINFKFKNGEELSVYMERAYVEHIQNAYDVTQDPSGIYKGSIIFNGWTASGKKINTRFLLSNVESYKVED